MKIQSKKLLRMGFSVGTAVVLILVLFAALSNNVLAAPSAVPVFINEIHYDNAGTDIGEAVEIAGPAGTDLTDWSIVLYNGNGGVTYTTSILTSTIPDLQNGCGTVYISYPSNGIQNGAPDGLALVDASNTLVQFLSYEGVITATNGPANGMTSVDIGVSESSGTPIGYSMQLTGIGTNYEDFTWADSITDTFGDVNEGQTFNCGSPAPQLSIVKSVTPATAVTYQSPVTYTIALENNGSVSDTAVLFTDTLPISTTFGSWIEQPAGASVANNEITWSGTVTNGQAITFTFIADQTASYGTTITNTAEYSGTTDNGLAEAAFTVEAVAGDITFIYHDLEDVVKSGESIYLAGDFNSWNTTAVSLTADAGFETFSVTLLAIDVGTYGYKYIVYTDTVPTGPENWEWLNTDNRSYTVAGTATVNDYRNVVVGYAVLYGPASLTTTQTFPTEPISGAVWINNVTTPIGEARGLMAQVGFGNDSDPGVWTWFDAGFIGQDGDNDVFEGSITPWEPGVFSYTNRFNGNWGAGNPNSAWAYGDLDGVHPSDPFELSNTGVVTVEAAGVCVINPSHRIHDIQGSGSSTPIYGSDVTVNAVVVGDFQEGGYNGFYIQEMDQYVDADPVTSEGVFVYYPANTVDVAVGDVVYVAGKAGEFSGQTQITSVSNVAVCDDTGATVTPATVDMPHMDVDDLESVEGMLVTIPDELTVTDNYNTGRYGETILSSSGRQFQYTHLYTPSISGYADYKAEIALNRILLDDGLTAQNPLTPMPYLNAEDTIRAGSTITNLTGVMGYGFGNYRIQPTGYLTFTQNNPRDNVSLNGALRIASLNVLNYFTTIDDSGPICGPSENMDCRGADTQEELDRQRAKLISAVMGLDADVLGFMEIENNIDDEALVDLVDSLNAEVGAGTYAYIDTGTIGSDAIKVALIYKPASVTPVGDYAILDNNVDPNYQDDRNRPSLAQTFIDNATRGRITVSINHLKSKGGCGDATGDDADMLDGQGCWNATRTTAAEILADWLYSDPTDSGSENFLILGDLNAYAMEDPITALKDAGFINLIETFLGEDAYSYSFNGEFGYLDYALASSGLLDYVADTSQWHINSDEPRALDYNNFNQEFFYNPDEFRASDHDPVLVGIDLPVPTVSILSPMADEVFITTKGTAVSVPVTITTTNFAIPADGHWHLWVDGGMVGPILDYSTTVELGVGTHVISAELRTADHVVLGPVDTVTVTVEEKVFETYLPLVVQENDAAGATAVAPTTAPQTAKALPLLSIIGLPFLFIANRRKW